MSEERFMKKSYINTDIQILSELNSYRAEADSIRRRKERVYEQMTDISPHLTGMPSGHGGDGGLENAFARLEEVYDLYSVKLKTLTMEIRKAEKIMSGIQDSHMRSFVRLKYMDHLSSGDIREKLRMKEWGYRMACEAIENAPCMEAVVWRSRWITDKLTIGKESEEPEHKETKENDPKNHQ